jgi:anti-anti-sigma factor
MQYEILQKDGNQEIHIKGKFVHHDREQFLEIVDGFVKSNANSLVLDFHETNFMDSAALGLMLLVKKSVQTAKKNLVIRSLSKRVEKMFQLMNYDKIFTIE